MRTVRVSWWPFQPSAASFAQDRPSRRSGRSSPKHRRWSGNPARRATTPALVVLVRVVAGGHRDSEFGRADAGGPVVRSVGRIGRSSGRSTSGRCRQWNGRTGFAEHEFPRPWRIERNRSAKGICGVERRRSKSSRSSSIDRSRNTAGNLLGRNGAVGRVVSRSSIVDGHPVGILDSPQRRNLAHAYRHDGVAQVLAKNRLERIADSQVVGTVLVEIEQAVSWASPFRQRARASRTRSVARHPQDRIAGIPRAESRLRGCNRQPTAPAVAILNRAEPHLLEIPVAVPGLSFVRSGFKLRCWNARS